MNNDVLEVLDELQELLDSFKGASPDVNILFDFIDNQRNIYSGNVGECGC